MKSFRYVYDFGDDWEHKIKVEKVLPPDASVVPLCVGGANAVRLRMWAERTTIPQFLNAIADPAHPEHVQVLEWNSGPFDPTVIDHEAIDRRLRNIKL